MSAGLIKVGIVGGGWIALRHVPALAAADGVELVAACDVDRARAEAIAGPRNARVYERWEEMLERERLQAVWVCTPPLYHREVAVEALRRGLHVYLEKPIARTVTDGEAIVDAAQRSEAICMVGYQWHATELLDEIRDAVAGQSIGMLVGRNYGPVAGRPWFVHRDQGGGQILERCSHHIDLQRAIAGDVAAVQAAVGSAALAQGDAPLGDIEDVLTLLLHFCGGALGSVSSAWTSDGQPELYSLDVLASDASLWLDLGPDDFRLTGTSRGAQLQSASGDPFDRSIERFIEVVRSGDRERVFCKPSDALETLRVAVACERALADGGRIAVGP